MWQYIGIFFILSMSIFSEDMKLNPEFLNKNTKYLKESEDNLTKEKMEQTNYKEVKDDKYDNKHPDLGAEIPDLEIEKEIQLEKKGGGGPVLEDNMINKNLYIKESDDQNYVEDVQEGYDKKEDNENEEKIREEEIEKFKFINGKKFEDPKVKKIIYKEIEFGNKDFDERFWEIMDENVMEIKDTEVYIPNITSVKKYIYPDYITKLQEIIEINKNENFIEILENIMEFYFNADGYLFWFEKGNHLKKGDIYFRDIHKITESNELNIIRLSGENAKKIARMFKSKRFECLTNINEKDFADKKRYTIIINFIKRENLSEHIKYDGEFLLTEILSDYLENTYNK